MLIATWNINSIRARLELVSQWLKDYCPDLLCLQETKVDDPLFPISSFRDLGYYAQVHGQSSYNGVAFVSKKPLEDIRLGFGGELSDDPEALSMLDKQKRVISGIFEGIRVVNLYVPNGSSLGSEKYSYKLAWLSCLSNYLIAQSQRGERLCVLGDFNIALEARDIYNPEYFTGSIMASEPERRALSKILHKRLWDVFRVFEPKAGYWSWWDYRGSAWKRNRGWRIDHIYLCQELIDCARSCIIDVAQRGSLKPSDHVPVLLDLDWPPTGPVNGNANTEDLLSL